MRETAVKYLERTFSSNETCLLDLTAKGIEDLIPQVIDRMIGSGLLPAEERDRVIEVFLERERLVSTAIVSSRFFSNANGWFQRRSETRSPSRTATWNHCLSRRLFSFV
jgi:hypothetical protein